MLSIQDQIEKEINRLKNPSDFFSITRIPIRVGNIICAYLRPVPSLLIGEAKKDARLMTDWREKNKRAFFSWFHTTEERTKAWLANCYNNNTDIIFMVETIDKIPVGHLSIYNFDFEKLKCEFGRVLRGANIGPKSGMMIASRVVIDWAFASLKIRRMFLEVFENNTKAISLYKKIGFYEVSRIPLICVEEGNEIKWIKIDKISSTHTMPDCFALRMEIEADDV